MTPKEVNEGPVSRALALLPAALDTPEARVMLLAIGLQESRLKHRFQIVQGGGKGPARGLWQFERAGGVAGVLNHPATAELARGVCADRGIPPEARFIWIALEHDDTLAAAFARLLLYTDPQTLPALGNPQEAWALYLRTWRPGKPHPKTWATLYTQALKEVTS